MSSTAGNLLVLQGGGPTAVLNTTLFGVLDEARNSKAIPRIFGARWGMKGLIENDFIDLTDIAPSDLAALKTAPGASLGTSRVKASDAEMQRIITALDKHHIRHLLLIGGNGSLRGADAIAQAAEKSGYDLHIIGIPKTIDNDIPGTDRSPGFGSAARYAAQSVRDLGTDVRSLPQPVSIYETMGRSVGWLAGATALGKLDENSAPHLIYLPEKLFETDRFLADLDRLVRRIGYAIVVVAEGIRTKTGNPVFEAADDSQRDAMNRALPGDVAAHLAKVVTRELKIRCRSEKPGICGRSSMLHVSPQDQFDAELVAREGVRAALAGATRMMVSLKPLNSTGPKFELVPLSAATGPDRAIPSNWLSDSPLSVAQPFIDYAREITGDLPPCPLPLMDRSRKT